MSLYVVAVQKKIVDGLVSLLESFGIKPAGVEPDVTALLNYALFSTGPNKRPYGILAASEHSWDLLGVESKGDELEALLIKFYSRTACPIRNGPRARAGSCCRESRRCR